MCVFTTGKGAGWLLVELSSSIDGCVMTGYSDSD